MKKICIMVLVLALSITVAACGRRDTNETTAPTTTPSTGMDIIPDMDQTIGTNIPDPNVDSTMPMYTDGTEDTIEPNMGSDTLSGQDGRNK